jgi:uncharacterized protein (UPF0333 family)
MLGRCSKAEEGILGLRYALQDLGVRYAACYKQMTTLQGSSIPIMKTNENQASRITKKCERLVIQN